MRLVDDWRDAWRFTSIWASGAGLGALTVWNMMPAAVRGIVPDWIEVVGGIALWGVVIVARLAPQPKLQEKRDAAGQ